jgi:hypothetical protein
MRETIGLLGPGEPADLPPEARHEMVALFLRYREESAERG